LLKKRKGAKKADGKAIKEEAGAAEEDANVPGPPPLHRVKRGGGGGGGGVAETILRLIKLKFQLKKIFHKPIFKKPLLKILKQN
jgi:hypothetical protein